MPRNASEKVLQLLTDIHQQEIGAIGIYMDQHYKMADAGYEKYAGMLESDAKDEMKHAERIAERILTLGAKIKYGKHDVPVVEMDSVTDIAKANIGIELRAIDVLNKAVKTCFDEGDNVTRIMLEEILVEEEQHWSESEKILTLIGKHGDTYIVTHLT